jgi:hypothetical protein
MRWIGAALAVGLCALAGCNRAPRQPDAADLQAARQAALAFDMRLHADVLARLDRGEDPVAVYMAYRDAAAALAAEMSGQNGLELSRTALRVRNPADTPDDWERRQLEAFQILIDEGGLDPVTLDVAEIVEETDGQRVFRWMKPLVADEACMTCHGDAIDARLLRLLERDYPVDEATGYYESELRGAYSVRRALE